MTRTRYGACPLCVRFRACPLSVRCGACPVCVRCGVCPVCGMGGLSPVCRSWADCWSFFSWLRPEPQPRWALLGCAGAGVTLGEMALDYRRRRLRRRWRDAGLLLLSLSVVWIVIMPPFFFGECPTRRSWPAPRWDWASRRSSHASSACCAGGVCAPRLKCAFGS